MPLICVRYIVDADELAIHSLDAAAAMAAAKMGVDRGIKGFAASHPDDEWDIEICAEPLEALKAERQLEMGFEAAADWALVAQLDRDIRGAVAAALADAAERACERTPVAASSS